MEFKPKSEEEVKKGSCMPAGEYDFEVLEASDAISKKGSAMIKIHIGLYDGPEIAWRVFDYLLPQMEAKLRHFCDSTGLLSKYESGTLTAADCKGRAGKVQIVVEQSEQYGAQNKVKDYVCRAAKPLTQPVKEGEPAAPPEDYDVPF